MTNRVVSFLALWGLNVLAAYAPAVLYVPGLAGSAGAGWKFLFSPVLLAGLWLWVTDPAVAWCLLIAFVGALGLASAVLCRVRRAWTVVPGIVGVYSLVQGLFAAAVINGIDGVGHS